MLAYTSYGRYAPAAASIETVSQRGLWWYLLFCLSWEWGGLPSYIFQGVYMTCISSKEAPIIQKRIRFIEWHLTIQLFFSLMIVGWSHQMMVYSGSRKAQKEFWFQVPDLTFFARKCDLHSNNSARGSHHLTNANAKKESARRLILHLLWLGR